MNLELISMLGGGVAGFVFNFMAAQAEQQSRAVDSLIKLQGVADDSSDRAAARGGTFGRRVLLFAILFLVAAAPFFGALLDVPTFVETERADWDLLGIFTGGYEELKGIIILEEVRAALIAAVGYWLGGAAVGRKR